MLGSLSSLGELVKLFIFMLSKNSTQNKLGLTQVFYFGICWSFQSLLINSGMIVVNNSHCASIASSVFDRARIQ